MTSPTPTDTLLLFLTYASIPNQNKRMPKIWRDLVDYFGSITALRDGQQPANNNLPVAYIKLSAD